MVILFLIYFAICVALSIKITNWLFGVLCNILGADAIYYTVRFKLIAYFVVTLVLVYAGIGILGMFFY